MRCMILSLKNYTLTILIYLTDNLIYLTKPSQVDCQ